MRARARKSAAVLVTATMVSVLTISTARAQEPRAAEPEERSSKTEEPREIGLVERAGRGLVQLDVTVRGPQARISALAADDFELAVNGRPIDELVVDRLCGEPVPEGRGAASVAGSTGEPAPAPRRPVSYLFYFDQHHLTMEGRVNALDNARLMIPELVRDGNRATIVSSGETLESVVEMTDDVDALLEGLDRLEGDRRQWDIYPEQEERRIRDVMEKIRVVSQSAACGLARSYQLEESFRTDTEMMTLSIVLGLLADVDPPKAVVYFADTMRRRAGQHYFSYVGCSSADYGSFGSEHAVDRVIHEASANGIRLYTVQAQGLVGESSVAPAGGSLVNASRVREAQDSLAALALETGGQSFLNGVPAPKMVRAIEEDLACLYLLSFDPEGLPLDAPLRVLLRVDEPKVKLQVRGQLVVQSESRRRTSRLLSAFATPGSVDADMQVQAVIVPTGFEDGRYTALVQLATPGSPLSEAEWDLGASLVSRGELKDDVAGHISIRRPGVPAILESEMRFRPGPFELIAVGQDTVADLLGTARVAGTWPEKNVPALGPIAVLQPANGVFVRDGEVRLSGPLGREERDLLQPDRPTALVGLVCRGSGGRKESFRVERTLVGEESTAFPPIEIEGDEPCVQVRDMIPAGMMTAGSFSYEVRVFRGDEEVASSSRDFAVAETEASGG